MATVKSFDDLPAEAKIHSVNQSTCSSLQRCNSVYCGRKNPKEPNAPFGNPFSVYNEDQDLCKYDLNVLVCRKYFNWVMLPAQKALRNKMRLELKGKSLRCYCNPLPCHT